jgi:hypothetical protein
MFAREVRLDTLSADSLKRAFATAKELAANNGAPPIQEPNGIITTSNTRMYLDRSKILQE